MNKCNYKFKCMQINHNIHTNKCKAVVIFHHETELYACIDQHLNTNYI